MRRPIISQGVAPLILLALATLATTANAHHSWASIFDAEGDIEIDGVVTKILWRNPHIQL